jgi:hypothetical protein
MQSLIAPIADDTPVYAGNREHDSGGESIPLSIYRLPFSCRRETFCYCITESKRETYCSAGYLKLGEDLMHRWMIIDGCS